jgi:hypothetical protein
MRCNAMRRRGEAWRWQQEFEISTVGSLGTKGPKGGEPNVALSCVSPDLKVGLKGPPGNVNPPTTIKYLKGPSNTSFIVKERRLHLQIFLHFAAGKYFNFK